MDESYIEYALYFSYFLLVVGLLAAIILPLIKSLDNPKSLIKVGVSVVGLVLLFIIMRATASSDLAQNPKFISIGISESVLQSVGGMLSTVYVLMFVAILGIIYSEISKAFK